jgi:paraquat-inducible protein B
MSILSNRKPSGEESSAEVDEEMNEVRLKIKAVEHRLKGGKSDPSADIHDVVPIYRNMSQDCLESTLQQLQAEKNMLLKMKLDIGNKGTVINDYDGNNFIDVAFAAIM